MEALSIDPARCPLCNAPNDCGMAAGRTECWCFTHEIPAEVLDAVPAEAAGVACVCRACASRPRAAGDTVPSASPE